MIIGLPVILKHENPFKSNDILENPEWYDSV